MGAGGPGGGQVMPCLAWHLAGEDAASTPMLFLGLLYSVLHDAH